MFLLLMLFRRKSHIHSVSTLFCCLINLIFFRNLFRNLREISRFKNNELFLINVLWSTAEHKLTWNSNRKFIFVKLRVLFALWMLFLWVCVILLFSVLYEEYKKRKKNSKIQKLRSYGFIYWHAHALILIFYNFLY